MDYEIQLERVIVIRCFTCVKLSFVKIETSSKYAEKRRNDARPADPIEKPLVVALVVLPTASNKSVISRTASGCSLISTIPDSSPTAMACVKSVSYDPIESVLRTLIRAHMYTYICVRVYVSLPPALSAMGPNMSMVSTYAAVDNIPMVAIAVPYNPPQGLPSPSRIPLVLPSQKEPMIANVRTITGRQVDSRPWEGDKVVYICIHSGRGKSEENISKMGGLLG